LPKTGFKARRFDVFWTGGMPSWLKLDPFLQNRGVQKLKLPKCKSNSCSPNPIMLQKTTLICTPQAKS
jgi:hypothetical protein